MVASIWMFKTNFDFEPILAVLGTVITLIGYYFFENRKEQSSTIINAENRLPSVSQSNVTHVNPVFNVNPVLKVDRGNDNPEQNIKNGNSNNLTKDQILDLMKPKTKILFVDDDTKFNLVKILKDSGWNNTSSIRDIKTLDIQQVKNAHILFIDIHGVGKLLNCKFEGLDLAQMIKQKYPEKKVVIYSADSQNNIFHEALKLADNILEKNALPYQFQVIVERSSIDIFEKKQ
jgi:hypothetical protein